MTDDLAGKVLDAYRTSPLLTGLLLLNALVIGGYGWWEYDRGRDTKAFIMHLMEKEDTLQQQLLTLAKSCSVKGVQ